MEVDRAILEVVSRTEVVAEAMTISTAVVGMAEAAGRMFLTIPT